MYGYFVRKPDKHSHIVIIINTLILVRHDVCDIMLPIVSSVLPVISDISIINMIAG